MHLGARVVRRQRQSRDGQRVALQERLELPQECRNATGAVEVLDQPFAGGPQVRDQRGAARDLVEAVELERDTAAAGQREQVDDRVRAAADRHQQRDRVVEGGRGEDAGWPQALLRRARPRGDRSPRRRGSAPRARRGSSRSPAAPSRAPRRSRPWSRRCRARCSGRRSASPRPRARRSRPRSCGRRGARPRSARGRCRRRARDRGSMAGSAGPPVSAIAGTSALAAPISCAGTVLSQPPSSTTASSGYERIDSSTSIDMRLR